MDHHYLPQFYLRGWAGSDGRLWRYRREPSGKISERHCSPKGTAFEPDLYAVADAGPVFRQPKPHIIETEFFQRVDDNASRALNKLIANPIQMLDEQERKHWALFVNSLPERHPSRLFVHDEQAPEIANEVCIQMLARCPPENRERLVAALEHVDRVQLSRNMVREHMVKETRADDVVDCYANRRWLVVDARNDDFLITSDAPLVINGGKQPEPITLLTMALSPEKLLIMHPRSWQMDEDLVADLLLLHNLMLLDTRPRFVYAREKIQDRPVVRLRCALEQCLSE